MLLFERMHRPINSWQLTFTCLHYFIYQCRLRWQTHSWSCLRRQHKACVKRIQRSTHKQVSCFQLHFQWVRWKHLSYFLKALTLNTHTNKAGKHTHLCKCALFVSGTNTNHHSFTIWHSQFTHPHLIIETLKILQPQLQPQSLWFAIILRVRFQTSGSTSAQTTLGLLLCSRYQMQHSSYWKVSSNHFVHHYSLFVCMFAFNVHACTYSLSE